MSVQMLHAERAGIGMGNGIALEHMVLESDDKNTANRKRALARATNVVSSADPPPDWRQQFR
jgi:hypothetical protein